MQVYMELSRNNTSKHNVLYTKEKVDEFIDKVLHAKTVLKKNDQERHLLKKFDKEENTLTIFYKIMSKVLLVQSTSSFQIKYSIRY
jgi:hypothetical protein